MEIYTPTWEEEGEGEKSKLQNPKNLDSKVLNLQNKQTNKTFIHSFKSKLKTQKI
jgi:hypothetical protein